MLKIEDLQLTAEIEAEKITVGTIMACPGPLKMTIQFPHCTVEWIESMRLCVTRFKDGTEAHACPHETPAYHEHAWEKSTGDVDLYCWQHDLAHCIVGLMKPNGISEVLWNIAHGLPTDTPECEAEEREAQELQKRFFLR